MLIGLPAIALAQRRQSALLKAFAQARRRDFQSTPALIENPDTSITIFDYHRPLSKAGWKVTHRIECLLSSERLSGNHLPVRCTQTGVQKNAGQTYLRNCWKDFANRKEIIMKSCAMPDTVLEEKVI